MLNFETPRFRLSTSKDRYLKPMLYISRPLGCRQVVRQRVLDPSFQRFESSHPSFTELYYQTYKGNTVTDFIIETYKTR